MSKPRVIAFYLSQFHSIKENDEWWGKGFTEWTNVGKAKSLYPGHKQPKVPTELGYYDLLNPITYKKQTELAKEAKIEGFCIWHYYFGDGKLLLEKPVENMYEDKTIDFPYCFGWANESWQKKKWNKDSSGDVLLIEQRYNGMEDHIKHFNYLLKYFKDDRYIKVNGCPFFMIYRPDLIPNCDTFINLWQKLAKENGLPGIHFVADVKGKDEFFNTYLEQGFSAIYSNRMLVNSKGFNKNPVITIKNIFCKILAYPRLINFNEVIKDSISENDKQDFVYPGILCGWDHTPRSGRKGTVVTHFTMKLFKKHIDSIFNEVKLKDEQKQIVILKSWNEWGEGNFMEPDMEYNTSKIDIIRQEIEKYE